MRGVADGPALELTVADTDFGMVSAGCTVDTAVTLHNAGTTDLTISAATLDFPEFTLTGDEGELPALPWVIPANGRIDAVLSFAPRDEGTLAAVLRVDSDDPVNPSATVDVFGQGEIEAANTLEWQIAQPENVVILFAINEVAMQGGRLFHAVSDLVETLEATRAHYRISLVTQTNGVVYGDLPYVDDSYTAEEIEDALRTMASNAGGDNDYLFTTFAAAIEENRSWMLDESEAWAGSRLSFVGINSDMEQSPGDYYSYLLDLWEYKEEPEDIIVSAVGGTPASGGGGSCAEPFTPFWDAATDTSGYFGEFCDPDWGPHFAAIATAAAGEAQHFVLTGTPAEWSIEVWVDDIRQSTGWAYDASTQEIVFEDDVYPAPGSDVRVEYIQAVECAE